MRRIAKRRRYLELKQDPEWLANRRAYERDWHRKRSGTKSTKRSKHQPPASVHSGPVVESAPFAGWLQAFNETPAEIARVTGINERRIRSVLNGEQENVELDTVDQALCNAGRPDLLDSLYPMEAAA